MGCCEKNMMGIYLSMDWEGSEEGWIKRKCKGLRTPMRKQQTDKNGMLGESDRENGRWRRSRVGGSSGTRRDETKGKE